MKSENIWWIFERPRIRRGCYNLGDESTRLGRAENHGSRSSGSDDSTSFVVVGIFHGAGCAPGEIFCAGAGWAEPRGSQDAGGTYCQGRADQSGDRRIPLRDFGVTGLDRNRNIGTSAAEAA